MLPWTEKREDGNYPVFPLKLAMQSAKRKCQTDSLNRRYIMSNHLENEVLYEIDQHVARLHSIEQKSKAQSQAPC